jgi:acetylglutamate kinase
LTTVLKLGGELLEDAGAVRSAAAAIVRLAARRPVVVVHGGGRMIDAELRARGITPRFADGLRVTDEPTLDTVVAVLAGRANTSLVAAIGAAGGRAVGLTGADAGIGLSTRAPAFRTHAGDSVDLGLVGDPAGGDTTLLRDLLAKRYVPVVASIGVAADGTLLNVNADTLAASLAAALPASRLIVAGTTPGVLDRDGKTIAALTLAEVAAMAASGTAHSGMLAKLAACRHALTRGVAEVAIVAGRGIEDFDATVGTRVYAG